MVLRMSVLLGRKTTIYQMFYKGMEIVPNVKGEEECCNDNDVDIDSTLS